MYTYYLQPEFLEKIGEILQNIENRYMKRDEIIAKCQSKAANYFTKEEYGEIRSLLSDLYIKRTYKGYKFDFFFNLKYPHNGSDPKTKDIYYNAIKYQVISNWEHFKDLSEEHKQKLIILYAVKLLCNINNCIDYCYNDASKPIAQGEKYNVKIYDPIKLNDIWIISKDLYKQIYIDDNYTVYTINGNEIVLPKEYKYIAARKRLTKEQMEEAINSFSEAPTIMELKEHINNNNYSEIPVADTLLWKYLEAYQLVDKIKRCRKSKLQKKEERDNELALLKQTVEADKAKLEQYKILVLEKKKIEAEMKLLHKELKK